MMNSFGLVMLVLSLITGPPVGAQAPASGNGALKIVVIAGEGAVNIIQHKTAVAPIVEVRDRNDLPVAGATVTFAITGGKSATFAGGAQSITVTTNAAGRAAAAALNPLNNGAVQIHVSAAFEGQTAVATIGQTNVATAAQASAANPAKSNGGGLSGTTIGLVAAAAAGGAAYVVKNAEEGGGSVAPTMIWMLTTFANGAQITPCRSPAATCELKLSDNNAAGQLHIEMKGVSNGVEHKLLIDCGGCEGVNSTFDSRLAYAFGNPFDGPKSGSATIGYVPGLRYSRIGAYPLQVSWTTGGVSVLSFSILITVVP